MTKWMFGINGLEVEEYAIAANAVLGIRDSGKTYTATKATEELFDAGIPSLWLDPIGVAHNLRIPGAGKGYPIVVAGGVAGDLPLTTKNAVDIVRAAMKSGVSLVIDLFSMDLSKSDWRKIVMDTVNVLLHENKQYGMRHVFIEEAAEFVPQRPVDMHVFAAVEKMVRMGGNSMLGCTLVNQRSADLNKSVLELCANVFVHRQKGKNTLLDLKKWFTLLDLSDEEQDKIADSLPNLSSGECWALLNDVPKPVFLKIPAKNSLHPDRRAKPSEIASRKAPVPADAFVEQMKAALAAKAPKPLHRPEQAVSAKGAPGTSPAHLTDRLRQSWIAPAIVEKREAEAFARGREQGRREGWATAWPKGFEAGSWQFRSQVHAIAIQTPDETPPAPAMRNFVSHDSSPPRLTEAPRRAPTAAAPQGHAPAARQAAPARTNAPKANGHAPQGGLTRAQQRALDAVAWWEKIGISPVARDRACVMAGLSPKASTFSVYVSELLRRGLLESSPGSLALTEEGRSLANFPEGASQKELHDMAASLLSPKEREVFETVYEAFPDAIDRGEVADALGLSRTASTCSVYLSGVSSKGIIEAAGTGKVRAAEWLFP